MFKKLLMLFALLALIPLTGCLFEEDDDDSTTAAISDPKVSFFRRYEGFSNNLYWCVPHPDSPLHGTSKITTTEISEDGEFTTVQEFDSDGKQISYVYESEEYDYSSTTVYEGAVGTVTYDDGDTATWTLNDKNLITAIAYESGVSLEFSYDGWDQTSYKHSNSDGSSSYENEYTFDGELPKEAIYVEISYNSYESTKHLYSSADGKVTKKENYIKYDEAGEFELYAETEYTYDGDKVVKATNSYLDAEDNNYIVVYEWDGDVIVNETRYYGTEETSTAIASTTTYTYDSKGRITETKDTAYYDYSDGTPVTQVTTTTYTYE